jgi:hypothetical protein
LSTASAGIDRLEHAQVKRRRVRQALDHAALWLVRCLARGRQRVEQLLEHGVRLAAVTQQVKGKIGPAGIARALSAIGQQFEPIGVVCIARGVAPLRAGALEIAGQKGGVGPFARQRFVLDLRGDQAEETGGGVEIARGQQIIDPRLQDGDRAFLDVGRCRALARRRNAGRREQEAAGEVARGGGGRGGGNMGEQGLDHLPARSGPHIDAEPTLGRAQSADRGGIDLVELADLDALVLVAPDRGWVIYRRRYIVAQRGGGRQAGRRRRLEQFIERRGGFW